jgi:hypothetical protein
MQRAVIFGVLSLGLMAVAQPVEAASKLIAVLPLDVSHAKGQIDADAEASLEEMLRDVAAAHLAKGGWTVLTGETTLQVLKDNGVDATACSDQTCHLSMARELKAETFVSGGVQFVEGTFTASVRLIDAATGKIRASTRVEAKTVTELRQRFEARADEFFALGGLHPTPATASRADRPQNGSADAGSSGVAVSGAALVAGVEQQESAEDAQMAAVKKIFDDFAEHYIDFRILGAPSVGKGRRGEDELLLRLKVTPNEGAVRAMLEGFKKAEGGPSRVCFAERPGSGMNWKAGDGVSCFSVYPNVREFWRRQVLGWDEQGGGVGFCKRRLLVRAGQDLLAQVVVRAGTLNHSLDSDPNQSAYQPPVLFEDLDRLGAQCSGHCTLPSGSNGNKKGEHDLALSGLSRQDLAKITGVELVTATGH